MTFNDTDFPEENEDPGIVKEGFSTRDEEGDMAQLTSMRMEEMLDEDLIGDETDCSFE